MNHGRFFNRPGGEVTVYNRQPESFRLVDSSIVRSRRVHIVALKPSFDSVVSSEALLQIKNLCNTFSINAARASGAYESAPRSRVVRSGDRQGNN